MGRRTRARGLPPEGPKLAREAAGIGQVELYGLPGDAWRNDPGRIFDVYIEAQIWSDTPVMQPLSRG
jgi:hypothetical protein